MSPVRRSPAPLAALIACPVALVCAPAFQRASVRVFLRVSLRVSVALVCLGVGVSPPSAQASEAQVLKPVKLSPGTEAAKPTKATGTDAKGQAGAAAPAASAASAPRVDPVELLRRRLAEKLAGGSVTAGVGAHELRVVANGVATPAPPAPRAARAVGQGRATRAAASAPVGRANWSYQGPAGPQTWGGLKPEFNLCGNGQRQSPIDIRGGLAVDLEPVLFSYQPSPFGVIDNGYTVQANVAPGNRIEVGGKRYELVQFHFHRPSEERIDGRQFEMSLHLVHKDEQGRLAVVAVLMDKGDKGPAQPAVQKVWNNLPLEKGEELAARVPLELSDLLPVDRRYYTYMGSLTTPPCSEGVQWVVMREPVTLSADQIDLFARLYPMNARPLQQASGRRILQSQ